MIYSKICYWLKIANWKSNLHQTQIFPGEDKPNKDLLLNKHIDSGKGYDYYDLTHTGPKWSMDQVFMGVFPMEDILHLQGKLVTSAGHHMTY